MHPILLRRNWNHGGIGSVVPTKYEFHDQQRIFHNPVANWLSICLKEGADRATELNPKRQLVRRV